MGLGLAHPCLPLSSLRPEAAPPPLRRLAPVWKLEQGCHIPARPAWSPQTGRASLLPPILFHLTPAFLLVYGSISFHKWLDFKIKTDIV